MNVRVIFIYFSGFFIEPISDQKFSLFWMYSNPSLAISMIMS